MVCHINMYQMVPLPNGLGTWAMGQLRGGPQKHSCFDFMSPTILVMSRVHATTVSGVSQKRRKKSFSRCFSRCFGG